MDARRLDRIQEIFHSALQRPAEERPAFLDAACGGDAELRAAVERYLLADADDFSLLDTPIVQAGAIPSPQTTSPLSPGERVGGYEIERKLGQGGMGIVYLAFDQTLNRHVALKLLPAHLSASEEANARFLHEARAAASLDHPHIATIFEVGETDADRLFIAMAYYEGETLDRKIARGPLDLDAVLTITHQVARGLEAAHKKKIVHRDIKPSNLIVTPEGQVKILDFGIAKVAEEDKVHAGLRAGTVAYMSPEQAQGEEIDHRTDLWSLGVVLYEMITGIRPFQGEYQKALIDSILHEEPTRPSENTDEISEALWAIANRLLAKDRADRYPRAAELLADLDRMTGRKTVLFDTLTRIEVRERLTDNLPAPLTSFVGRRSELQEAVKMLAGARLLTLTGAGGTGKTRLGLRIAETMKEDFQNGVCFVPLASINDAKLVAPTIAQTLGVREMGNIPIEERVKAFLKDKNGLLMLDNFEHVTDAGPFIAELLSTCPGMKTIVTSRVPLHVQGEHEFPVPPLNLPRSNASMNVDQLVQVEAVQLFLERARAIKPGFELNPANASVVAEICAYLDGLPLAIELAAARIKVLSPRAILLRLQHRFDLLTSGAHDLPARHRTLREAIGWSYDLLTKDEKKLFRRLSVFVKGLTLEAAKQVAGIMSNLSIDILDGTASLVDKNLMLQVEQPDGEPRFFMLETIREFGLECLIASGEEAMARGAHGDYYHGLAKRAESRLTGPRQMIWFDRLEQEHDNLRAALEWSLANGGGEIARAIGRACWRFWLVRGYFSEGRTWLKQILESGGAMPSRERAQILTALGILVQNQGDFTTAHVFFQDGLELYRKLENQQGIARSLNHLGWLGWRFGDYESARGLSEEGLTLHRRSGDKRGIATSLNNLGWVAHYRCDYSKAREYFQESLALHRSLGDERGAAFALTNLSKVAHQQGLLDEAAASLDEALAMFEALGDKQLFAFALNVLADVVLDHVESEIDPESAGVTLIRMMADKYGANLALDTPAEMGYPLAARFYEQSMNLWKETGDRWGVARSLSRLGRISRILGEHEQAISHYRESLLKRREMGDKDGITECLEGMAALAHEQGRYAHAARLMGSAEAARASLGAPVPFRDRGRRETLLALLREHLDEKDFSKAWNDGREMSLDEAADKALNLDDAV